MKASKRCLQPILLMHSQVRTEDPTYMEGRCWVVQNTWGTDAGYNGLWLVNMDTDYDCGISSAAVIPLLQ